MSSALRANIDSAYKFSAVVATSQSVGQGIPCAISTAGAATPSTAATTAAQGVAYATEDGTWPATAGDMVEFIRIGSPCVAPVKVGTGGATKGAMGKATSDGTTDATLGGGTTAFYPVCQFEETGVAGDLVGGWLGVAPTVGS